MVVSRKTEKEGKAVLLSCRNCGKAYDNKSTTSDLSGYCTQKCLFAKAKALGWTLKVAIRFSVYQWLKKANQIGNVKLIQKEEAK
jgi:hypothetical protein